MVHQIATMGSLETPSIDCCRVASPSPDSHGKGSTLPHKQHRHACTSVELPSCQHGRKPRWPKEAPERPPYGVHSTHTTRGPHPWWPALLAQQTYATQRRLAARKRPWSQSDQRRNVLRTDGWTDPPRRNPTKQHAKHEPYLNNNIINTTGAPSDPLIALDDAKP